MLFLDLILLSDHRHFTVLKTNINLAVRLVRWADSGNVGHVFLKRVRVTLRNFEKFQPR